MRVKRPKKMVKMELSDSQKERLSELVATVHGVCSNIVEEVIEASGFHDVTLSSARAMIFKTILNFIMNLISYTYEMDVMALEEIEKEMRRK